MGRHNDWPPPGGAGHLSHTHPHLLSTPVGEAVQGLLWSLIQQLLLLLHPFSPPSATELAPMLTARQAFGMAAAQGKLYVAGGETTEDRTSSVEAYDPLQNRWEVVAPLSSARSEHAMAVMS